MKLYPLISSVFKWHEKCINKTKEGLKTRSVDGQGPTMEYNYIKEIGATLSFPIGYVIGQVQDT